MLTSDSFGMKYRFLGDSGLVVSAFSYGCLTFTSDDQVNEAYELLTHAYKHGVNFWDTFGAPEPARPTPATPASPHVDQQSRRISRRHRRATRGGWSRLGG
jgi:hypothetical protein